MTTLVPTPLLACPHCAKPIADDGRCSDCDLDASLLLGVRRAADGLAQKAARLASAGTWQAAYDTAEESLRLARTENDLAAFVLLLAAVAGAQGLVASVPKPRAEALPPSLAPCVDDVVATAERLRNIAGAGSLEEIEQVLRDFDPEHPLLAPASPAPPPAMAPVVEAPPAGEQTSFVPRRTWPLVTTAAGVALLAGLLTGRVTTMQQQASTHMSVLNEPSRIPSPPPAPAAPATVVVRTTEPWVDALRGLSPTTYAQVQDNVSARAWKQGRDASRGGRYEEARQFLELAVQGPRTSWYWQHALFYLGKTYHRLGRREEAAAAYRLLEREAPGSGYIAEARRLLARLEKGQGVDP